jgi:hypothetical protein
MTERKMDFMVLTCKSDSLTLFFIVHLVTRLLEHPWSRIADTFVNLEGAGAGGYAVIPPLG